MHSCVVHGLEHTPTTLPCLLSLLSLALAQCFGGAAFWLWGARADRPRAILTLGCMGDPYQGAQAPPHNVHDGANSGVQHPPLGRCSTCPLLARQGHKSAPFGRMNLKFRCTPLKMIRAEKFAAWTEGPRESPVGNSELPDRAPASIWASTERSRDEVLRC